MWTYEYLRPERTEAILFFNTDLVLLLHLQCAIAIDLIPQGVALGYGLYGLSARFSGQQ